MREEKNITVTEDVYALFLYIAGAASRSQQALINVKRICDEELKGRYTLQVIDIYKQPELAKIEQIVAVPTLLKKLPKPLQVLIGDLSDRERVLVGLNLRTKRTV